MRRHFYGAGLVVLGVWEAAALASRGRIPTVSRTCSGRRGRQAVLVLWMTGAAAHVVRHRVLDPEE